MLKNIRKNATFTSKNLSPLNIYQNRSPVLKSILHLLNSLILEYPTFHFKINLKKKSYTE